MFNRLLLFALALAGPALTPSLANAASTKALATQYAVLDSLIVGTYYSKTVTAVGGKPPYVWSTTRGTVPPGMALTPAGVFSGTPTTNGTYKFSVTVTDSTGATASTAQQLWVTGGVAVAPAAPLATQYATLDSLVVGTFYSKAVTATGGTLPYTWSYAGGSLPPGMGLTAAGVFSGTPTTNGDYKFTLVVTDALGATSSAAQELWVSGGATNVTTTTPAPPAPPTTPTNPTPPTTPTTPTTPVTPTTPALPTNPILFVTQIPIGTDFVTIGSTFGNHRSGTDSVGRGGDLYIRYPDGTTRNLTAAAGFGVATGFQGANSIAVRDPAVHWSGQKAIFSMVVGAPTTIYGISTAVWQLYEITNFQEGATPVITLVPNQPSSFNNLAPCYGTDGRIIFTSDRPRNGQPQLYPQLDEYELAPTVTGLWSLDPATGDLFNLNHVPSGVFTPSVDSFGRVIFTRWDHLQRDQEADIDNENVAAGQPLTYGTFNYSDETAAAQILAGNRTEVFPEPRIGSGNVNGHGFNLFFPWMIDQDGTQEETINHVGQHEIGSYAACSFNDDPNLSDGFNFSLRTKPTYVTTMLQLKEDPTNPGRYFGVDTEEFGTHASGMIVALTAPPTLNADSMGIDYITYPVTRYDAPQPAPATVGHYREPLPLSNGTLVAVHATSEVDETQSGVGSDYDFRLVTMAQSGAFWTASQFLTGGFSKSVSYYANDALVTYTGPLWELSPVEVRARPIPTAASTPLPTVEQGVFDEVGVSVATFQNYLRANNLALVVSRNVTTRDHADQQQPYNLLVPGTATQTIGAPGKIYNVSALQFLQGDQIRGFGLRNANSVPNDGRRVLAEPLHDPASVAANPANPGGPAGSVALGADGSMAAFLPARRAMTWQLTDSTGAPVVRERYWLTFQPGEIRSCTSCHGINTRDQANQPIPVNEPAALRALLLAWKAQNGG